MGTSKSYIMDMPVFPQDTAPKTITEAPIFEWCPFIQFIGLDDLGGRVSCYISVNFKVVRYGIKIQNRLFQGECDVSVFDYADGIMVVGSMPRLTVDFHVPHRVRLEITESLRIDLTNIQYRGPPLWYAKTTDPSDMQDLGSGVLCGGYVGLCSVEGVRYSNGDTLGFSGFGVWEHSWLRGEAAWVEVYRQWLMFNNSKFYGAVAGTKDRETGKWLMKTGRFGNLDTAFLFDDFVWTDDGSLLVPKYIKVNGPIKDLSGDIRGNVNLEAEPAESYNPFRAAVWMLHGRVFGTVSMDSDINIFEGVGFSDTKKFTADFQQTVRYILMRILRRLIP